MNVEWFHPLLTTTVNVESENDRSDLHYFVTAPERAALSERYTLPGDIDRNGPSIFTGWRATSFLSRRADTDTRRARHCNPFASNGRGKPQWGSLLERAHGSGYCGDISAATRRVRKRNRLLTATFALAERNPQALSQRSSTTLNRRAALERVTPGQIVLCPQHRGV